MTQVDPALEVLVVGRHILEADRVVEAFPRPADCGHDEIARPQERDVWRDGLDWPEALMTDDEEVVALQTVFGRVDFAVRAVHADTQHLHEHAAAVRDV